MNDVVTESVGPSNMMPLFLPGVPTDHVLGRLRKAGGNEIESGKLASPESSAALAVNTFGWFIERPELLPPIPGLDEIDWPAISADVEYCARFPWRGGRHPWLDALVVTKQCMIGVESKRFEPFRDAKTVSFSRAYDRPVWGDAMRPYERMRDMLRIGGEPFVHLDAAQLVKHAFGLVTQARLCGKGPYLVYLYAEPASRAGRAIDPAAIERHRAEVARFEKATRDATVRFVPVRYSEWLGRFANDGDSSVRAHGAALKEMFAV